MWFRQIAIGIAKTPLLDTPLTQEEIQSLQSLNSDPDLTVLIFQQDQTIQMLAAVGKLGKKVSHSPRRDVLDLIMK